MIEVILSLAIITFAFLLLLELISLGLSNNRKSQEETTVALIAKSIIADPLIAQKLSSIRYYNEEGIEAPPKQAVFRCDIRLYQTFSPLDVEIQLNCVEMLFSWPATAPEKNRKKRVIQTSLYDPFIPNL